MQDSDTSVIQGTPQLPSTRKENHRVTSSLKARSARSVIFSPNNTSHPYSSSQRPSLSTHPRSLLSRSKSGLQSPILTPTKGILKRTNSDEPIRIAKDVTEGTRVNGRRENLNKRASNLSMQVDQEVNPSSSSSPPSSATGQEILLSSSPPARYSPPPVPENNTPAIIADINTHIQTLLSAATAAFPYNPSLLSQTSASSGSSSFSSHQPYHYQTSPSDVAEAYTALTTRFRSFFLNQDNVNAEPTVELHGPLRANASNLIRAFTRDLGRLFTQPESSEENRGSSPSIADGDGGSSGAEGGGERKIRRGYSDEEITNRREEVTAGHAVLKWLALVFHVPEIFQSFSDADILSLLRILLKIPLSSQMPSSTTPFFNVTSASKRTYAFSIYALTHLRLPNRILLPVANDIIEACRRATTLSFPSTSSKSNPSCNPLRGGAANLAVESNSNVKAKVEGLGAIYNLLSRNGSIFLMFHRELVPILLRGLIDKTPSVRARASAALGAALAGGREWVGECEEALKVAVELERQKKLPTGGLVGKLEKERRKVDRKRKEDDVRKSRKVAEEDLALTVVGCLKKKMSGGPGKEESKMVQAIVVQLKTSLDKDSAHWAVATWAILISLLGRNVATHITDLLDFMNVARNTKNSRALTLLCRQAWDHVIHAFVSQSSRRISAIDPTIEPSADLYSYNLDWCLTLKRTKLLVTFVTTAKDIPSQIIETQDDSGAVVEKRWRDRKQFGTAAAHKTELLRISVESLTSLTYALTGALMNSATLPSSSEGGAKKQEEVEQAIKQSKHNLPAITVTTSSSTGNVLVPATSSATNPSSSLDAPSQEQIRMNHLTILFDNVVQPLLTPVLNITALDDVKLLGWSLLTAIFVPDLSARREFKLDRLLCEPFLRGEVGSFTSLELQSPMPSIRERALWELANSAARDATRVDEIESWPVEWTTTRFSQSVVKIFEVAVRGMRGLSDVDAIEWVRSVDGVRVLPVRLSNLWRGMLGALNSIKPAPDIRPSKTYLDGLLEVTSCINSLFVENPAAYVPPTLEFDCNLELVRYGLVEHLLSVVISVLGAEALSTVLSWEDESVLGAGRHGRPSSACILVSSLVSKKIPSAADDASARFAFVGLLEKLVDVGVAGELALKLLGDLTNNLEEFAADKGNDAMRLSLWTIITRKWTTYWPKETDPSQEVEEEDEAPTDASPAASFIPKSTTLDLLHNLLTDPFRRFPSAWATASEDSVGVWKDLLETTIGRCKAKKMSGNIVVVESISASLSDFEVAETPSRPSLECLIAITKVIRYPGANFPTNDANIALKLVMRDLTESFLTLLADTLSQAYTTVANQPDQVAPTAELLRSCAALLRELPIGFVPTAVQLLSHPVELWLADSERVLSPEVHLDGPVFLYETILSLLASTSLTREGKVYRVVQPTATQLRKLSPLLQAAASAPHGFQALDAFSKFWDATFAGVNGLEYPVALKEMLKGVRQAGMELDAVGMSYSQSQTQSQSQVVTNPFTVPYHPPRSQLETQDDSRTVHEESYDADRSYLNSEGQSGFTLDTLANETQEKVDVVGDSSEEDFRQPRTRSRTFTSSKDVEETTATNARSGRKTSLIPPSPARSATSQGSQAPTSTKRRRGEHAQTPVKRRQSSQPIPPLFPSPEKDASDEDEVLKIKDSPPYNQSQHQSSSSSSSSSLDVPPNLNLPPNKDHSFRSTSSRGLQRSHSSSVLATAVSWIPKMFRSPAKSANEVLFDPDETMKSDEVEARGGETESAPVTSGELSMARQRKKLNEEAENWDQVSGADSLLGLMEDGGDDEDDGVIVVEDEEEEDISHMSPASQGSSSGHRETPKSARRAHRQTERVRIFGTDTLIDQPISLILPGNDRKMFSPVASPEGSQQPSSSIGSLSLRAEPAILEDEPEQNDDIIDDNDNASPLAKRSHPTTSVSSLIFPRVAAALLPAPVAAPPSFESLLTSMRDQVGTNTWTSQELASNASALTRLLAVMQDQVMKKLAQS